MLRSAAFPPPLPHTLPPSTHSPPTLLISPSLPSQIEFIIDRSMDEATQLQQLDRFTISPALVDQLRVISSVVVPITPGTCPVNCVPSPCKSGALVTGIFENAEAQEVTGAGLHVGCVIVAINRVLVRGQFSVGRGITASSQKFGSVELTLARRTRREVIDRGDAKGSPLGVALCASPRGIGALVCKVRPRSLAEKHEIRAGDTILSVNDNIGETCEKVCIRTAAQHTALSPPPHSSKHS